MLSPSTQPHAEGEFQFQLGQVKCNLFAIIIIIMIIILKFFFYVLFFFLRCDTAETYRNDRNKELYDNKRMGSSREKKENMHTHRHTTESHEFEYTMNFSIEQTLNACISYAMVCMKRHRFNRK